MPTDTPHDKSPHKTIRLWGIWVVSILLPHLWASEDQLTISQHTPQHTSQHTPQQGYFCGAEHQNHTIADLKKTSYPISDDEHTEHRYEDGLEVRFNKEDAGITILPGEANWDLSSYVALAVDIENLSEESIAIQGLLEPIRSHLILEPKEKDALIFYIYRKGKPKDGREKVFRGMRGVPGGHLGHYRILEQEKAAKFVRIMDLDGSCIGHKIKITKIRGLGKYAPLTETQLEHYFPFVDEYGQFIHHDWTGKLKGPDALKQAKALEDSDISKYAAQQEWSSYGGWKVGPRQKATGHFRTEKVKGKWWLVDPEGYLFWSNGINGIKLNASHTNVKDRKHYFTHPGEPYGELFNKGRLSEINLIRKYGEQYRDIFNQRTHQRLKSWRVNTIGGWSDTQMILERKTPYTLVVHTSIHKQQVGDVLRQDPEKFRLALRKSLSLQREKHANDPWCIGYFINNELPMAKISTPDLYFRICREEMKASAPNKLYLGSRNHTSHHLKEAAKYCDVLSLNRYILSPKNINPESLDIAGTDKPIMITEFHFGALDRGLFHTGLSSSGSQEQRRRHYQHYMKRAIQNPWIVGAHWFRYTEQFVTGRKDGENFQVGFLDVCDSPYPELVETCREIGDQMYSMRHKSFNK
jgi:hypothetical protein